MSRRREGEDHARRRVALRCGSSARCREDADGVGQRRPRSTRRRAGRRSALDDVERLVLVAVDVRRRPAAGRDHSLHGEVRAAGLLARDEEAIEVLRTPVRLAGAGRPVDQIAVRRRERAARHVCSLRWWLHLQAVGNVPDGGRRGQRASPGRRRVRLAAPRRRADARGGGRRGAAAARRAAAGGGTLSGSAAGVSWCGWAAPARAAGRAAARAASWRGAWSRVGGVTYAVAPSRTGWTEGSVRASHAGQRGTGTRGRPMGTRAPPVGRALGVLWASAQAHGHRKVASHPGSASCQPHHPPPGPGRVLASARAMPAPLPAITEVAVVGAGFSGVGAAIRLGGEGADVVVLERAGEIGGTWRDNSYPGCACDVPSHLYSFSFAPPEPRGRAPSRRRRSAPTCGRSPRLRAAATASALDCEVNRAMWEAERSRWESRPAAASCARVVVSGAGPLSAPRARTCRGSTPSPARSSTPARWDHDYDLRGKRVAMSARARRPSRSCRRSSPRSPGLHLFQRTPPWVMPARRPRHRGAERRLYRACRRTGALVRGGSAADGSCRSTRSPSSPARWAAGAAGQAHLRRAGQRPGPARPAHPRLPHRLQAHPAVQRLYPGARAAQRGRGADGAERGRGRTRVVAPTGRRPRSTRSSSGPGSTSPTCPSPGSSRRDGHYPRRVWTAACRRCAAPRPPGSPTFHHDRAQHRPRELLDDPHDRVPAAHVAGAVRACGRAGWPRSRPGPRRPPPATPPWTPARGAPCGPRAARAGTSTRRAATPRCGPTGRSASGAGCGASEPAEYVLAGVARLRPRPAGARGPGRRSRR